MLRHRAATRRVLALARQFPAVAILGPRQVGKSTLAKQAFAEHALLDLENPIDLDRLQADPQLVLEENPRVVIDEAQRFPALFPLLRHHLDTHPRARVVLLGSAAPALTRSLSESLTGRIGIFELGGLSVFEEPVERLWPLGSFPRVHWSRPRARPEIWYPSYLRTCLEQDLPQLGHRVSSLRMRNLLTMVAHGQGSLSNTSELGASLGVSYHTVAHLLDLFEGVYLVRRLAPFHANLAKRLVKSAKLYVRDTGLLHSLLGMGFTRKALLSHPKAGPSFETFCIEQLIAHAQLADPGAEAYFYRTHAGAEVDLLLRLKGKLVPIEVKLGLGVPSLRGLEACMADLELSHGYVVYAGTSRVQLRKTIHMLSLTGLLRELGLEPEPEATADHARSRGR